MLDILLHNVKSHFCKVTPSQTFNINKLYEHRLCATAVVFYYIGKSVLMENRPLIKFIRNYIRDLSFHILTSEDIDDVISRSFTVVCANSR